MLTIIRDTDLLPVDAQMSILESQLILGYEVQWQKMANLLNRELQRRAISLRDYVALHQRLASLKPTIH